MVGVATLVALGGGREGIIVDGRCNRGHCSDGGELGLSLLLCLLVLLAPRLEQFEVGEKGLVCMLGLVLEPDLVSGLMILYGMLQDHDL